MALVVENISADGRHHVASLALQATALSTPAILKWLVTIPISGLGVLIAINWQALWHMAERSSDIMLNQSSAQSGTTLGAAGRRSAADATKT